MNTSIHKVIIKGVTAHSNDSDIPPLYTTLNSSPGLPGVKPAAWFQELLDNNAPGDKKVYTLAHTPYSPSVSLMIYVNGLLQRYSIDYTICHRTITFSYFIYEGANVNAIYLYQD